MNAKVQSTPETRTVPWSAVTTVGPRIMRLLNVQTLRLESFVDDSAPPYAIVSHTWTAEELTYDDIVNPQGLMSLYLSESPGTAPHKMGYKKLVRACHLAVQKGFEYLWIDTCCVDKTSSSEISDAIVSSYRWFKNAGICFAYLPDIRNDPTGDALGVASTFQKSRYFFRSWLLQELIAPSQVEFYDCDWEPCGTRSALSGAISQATGISEDILLGRRDPGRATVGEILSWTHTREATRGEDTIYSLIGLLKVNMDIRYGEGRHLASVRMREQILRDREDYTILMCLKPHGLLGRSPRSISRRDPSRHPGTTAAQPEWNAIKLHSPVDLLADKKLLEHLPFTEIPPDTPQLTGRGARMSLYAKKVQTYLLAWTYCTQERQDSLYAVCVRVFPLLSRIDADARYLRGEVRGDTCYVAINRLRGFTLRDIYFSVEE